MEIKKLIKRSLREDIGKRDITTEFLFPENFLTTAVLISKSNGILCGTEVFKKVFLELSSRFKFEFNFKDGEKIKKGNVVAEVVGPVKELLTGERTALNFLQRLSGIATETKKLVEETGKRVKIYDTRKTNPGLRILEKYAVKTGGGENHRFGLFDMVLIKDNHITIYMKKEKVDRVK